MRIIGNSLWITFFIINFGSISSAEQSHYPVSDIPVQLMENTHAVVRLASTEFEILSHKHAIEYRHDVITVLNKQGDDVAGFLGSYDKFRTVTFVEGYVYNRYGDRIMKVKAADIKDYSSMDENSLFSDQRTKAFFPSVGNYPYTVEYIWTIEYNGLLNYPGWNPLRKENLAIEHAEFQACVPNNMVIRIREFNITHTEIPGDQVPSLCYHWVVDTVPAYTKEAYAPMDYQYLPYVILAPEIFEIDGFRGNMSSWDSFGKWVYDLQPKNDKISKETENDIITLVANHKDRLETIRSIYEYVQKRSRYVSVQLGIGGWRPIAAGVIDRNGYGDCKALVNYTRALLEIAGIPAYYSLVYGGNDPGGILNDFPYNCFNHVILCVPDEQDTIWLECTDNTNPFGFTGGFTDNRYALVIKENGSALVRTHHYRQSDNTRMLTATVMVDSIGDALAEVTTIYSGSLYNIKKTAITMNLDEQKKFFYSNASLQNYSILKINYLQVKDIVPVAVETLKLSIQGLATTGTHRYYVTPNLLNRWKSIPSRSINRLNDIVIQRSFSDYDSIVYLLPKGCKIEYLPENAHYSCEFGSYSMQLICSGDSVIYIRKMHLNEGQYPAQEYQIFLNFLKNIARTDGEKVILRKIP